MKNIIFGFIALGVVIPMQVFGQPSATIYPPTLTEKTGDHVAFSVSLLSGAPSATYQWYFVSGGATNLLAGQTASSLVLTNIQTSNAGTYQVVVGNIGATLTNSAVLNVLTNSPPLLASNLVVLRIGDGAQPLSAATGNTIYLDQYTTQGIYVSTIQISDEGFGAIYGSGSSASTYGSPALILPGAGADAVYEGVLTTSFNQQYLCFAGYCLNYPFAGSDCTKSDRDGGDIWRGLGEVNAAGVYSLVYTNTGLFSNGKHTIRGMVSLDGVTNFWAAGEAGSGGGVKYVNSTDSDYAAGMGIPADSTATTNGTRVVQILSNGNLTYSDWFGSTQGIFWNQGTPEPGFSNYYTSTEIINEGGQPGDFAFSPDLLTVYIADDRTFAGSSAQSGGIERWDTTTPGSNYIFSYTLRPMPGAATNGASTLTVNFPTSITTWGPGVTGAVVYATSKGPMSNSIVRIADSGAGSLPSVLVTAGTNALLRGLRFGLGATPVITNGPIYFQTNGSGIRWSNGQVTLSLSGLAGQGSIVLDASTNLIQWVPLLTNPPAFGTIQLIDSNAGTFPQRFYRATIVP